VIVRDYYVIALNVGQYTAIVKRLSRSPELNEGDSSDQRAQAGEHATSAFRMEPSNT